MVNEGEPLIVMSIGSTGPSRDIVEPGKMKLSTEIRGGNLDEKRGGGDLSCERSLIFSLYLFSLTFSSKIH